jgi:hypothetical protein
MGLIDTYRLVHPGQGTRNARHRFRKLHCELLWIDQIATAFERILVGESVHLCSAA